MSAGSNTIPTSGDIFSSAGLDHQFFSRGTSSLIGGVKRSINEYTRVWLRESTGIPDENRFSVGERSRRHRMAEGNTKD